MMEFKQLVTDQIAIPERLGSTHTAFMTGVGSTTGVIFLNSS